MPEPQVGERFPSLVLEGPKGAKVRVPEDYAGRNVVLSWFPYAFSPVCTEELTSFARIDQEFQHLNATVVAASCDHWYSNVAYQASLGARYPFLSDWYRTEARKLGIFDEPKQRSGRAIYVLDKHGVLRWAKTYPTSVCPHADEFLPTLKGLA
jgi:alkyl hydroperoxide reductase subunit AhpC